MQQSPQPTMQTPPGMYQLGKYMAGSGTPASGAGSALTASEAATMAQASAQAASTPNSLAIGGEASGTLGSTGSAASGGMGAMAVPAAMVAAIVGNEYFANEAGRRDSNVGQQAWDSITGRNMGKDMDYFGDKVGGPGGSILHTLGDLARWDEPLGMKPEELFKPWEWFS